MLTVVLCLLLGLLLYYFPRSNVRGKVPPGPSGLPIVGYLPFLDPRFPEKSFMKLGRKYGRIFSIKMGVKHAIVLNDCAMLKEVFTKPQSFGRPDLFAFKFYSRRGQREGMAFNDGSTSQEFRRFTLRTLKDLGTGKSVMVRGIIEEAEALVKTIKKQGRNSFSLEEILPFYVVNVVWKMITGTRFTEDDEEFAKLITVVKTNMQNMTFIGLISCLPDFLINLIPKRLYNHNAVVEATDWMIKYTEAVMKKQEDSPDEERPLNFADAVIKEKKKFNGDNPFDDSYSIGILFIDLFVGGMDTVTTTLLFALIFLHYHPHVERRLREEIESVVGYDKRPTSDDRLQMCYTEAFINEVQRRANIAPLAIFHRALEDFTVSGYTIPKDYMIIGNLHAVHFDEGLWEDPYLFKPERFLDSSGRCQKSPEGFLPFSYGKRRCPGEVLATHELFYFITILLQEFRFSFPESPSMNKRPGLVCHPEPFKIICENINDNTH